MKIGFVTHYTNLHGANRSLLDLIRGLRPLGFEAIVFSPDHGPVTVELDRMDVPFIVTSIKYWMWRDAKDWRNRLRQNLFAAEGIADAARHHELDIIYSNSSSTPAGAFGALMAGTRHVFHIREFGALDFNLHHDCGRDFFLRWVKRSSAVICVSRCVRDHVLGRSVQTARVVFNGVLSTDRFAFIKETSAQRKRGEFVFTVIGQMNENKCQMEAITAFRDVCERRPDARLLIAGDDTGSYARKLKAYCEAHRLQGKVIFLGYVADPFSVLYRADALLMCSRFEAMGRVTAEAMLAGRPVIGRRSGGTSELIDHGRTGLLYDGGSRELARSMLTLIEGNGLAETLGRNAQLDASKKYLTEVYARKVARILSQLPPVQISANSRRQLLRHLSKLAAME